MPDAPKRIKRLLREYAAAAHEEGGPTAARCSRCRRFRRSPRIPSRFSAHITTRTTFRSTLGRAAQAGSGSAWMSDGRSTCYILAARNRAPDL